MPPIDFRNARLSWVTLDGICGDWSIVAAAESFAAPGEQFFLAPAVMAGDVFGAGRLPLNPAYSFQVFASSDRHVMMRRAEDVANAKRDTVAPNSATFANLQVHAPTRAADPCEIAELGPEQIQAAWPLSLKIELDDHRDRSRWSVQCPVNHINSRHGRAGVQVETGPVLLPEVWSPGTGADRLGGFMLAYIFWNRPREVELLALASDSRGHRTFSWFERIENASVVLYGTRA